MQVHEFSPTSRIRKNVEKENSRIFGFVHFHRFFSKKNSSENRLRYFQFCPFLLQDDFTSEDFAHMTAPLLFNMFKAKTRFPLHSAIRLRREDVVFLYLIEFNQQVRSQLETSRRVLFRTFPFTILTRAGLGLFPPKQRNNGQSF